MPGPACEWEKKTLELKQIFRILYFFLMVQSNFLGFIFIGFFGLHSVTFKECLKRVALLASWGKKTLRFKKSLES